MEIGTEISQKIRSAIKAKLMELGAYVDEELPDYIMVMVANRKSQAAMTEDLNLFLGGNTDKFTSWLHGLLTKLQSISTGSKEKKEDKPKPVKEAVEKAGDKKLAKTSHRKSTEKVEHSSAGKSKADTKVIKGSTQEKSDEKSSTVTSKVQKQTSKVVHVTESPELSSKPAEPSKRDAEPSKRDAEPSKRDAEPSSKSDAPPLNKTKPHSESTELSTAKQPVSVSKSAPTLIPNAAVPDVFNIRVSDDNVADSVSDVKIEPTPLLVHPEPPVFDVPEEPEFTVKAEYDEFSEEFSQEAEKAALAEVAKKLTSKERGAVIRARVESPDVDKKEELVDTSTTTTVFARISPMKPSRDRVEVIPRVRSLSSRLGSAPVQCQIVQSVSRHATGTMRKVSLDTTAFQAHAPARESFRQAVAVSSVAGVKRRMPGSVVGSVNLKSRRVVEEPEEEEYDPLNPAVGSVASVVKVTARRSSVPRKLQANSSLLMKAMNDATRSVGAKRQSRAPSYIPIGRSVERSDSQSRSLFTRSRRDEIMRSLKREALREQPQPVSLRLGVVTQPVVKMEVLQPEETEDDLVESANITDVVKQDMEVQQGEIMEAGDSEEYVNDSRLVNVTYKPSSIYKTGEIIETEEVDSSEFMISDNDSQDDIEEVYMIKSQPPTVIKVEPEEQLVKYTPTNRVQPSEHQQSTNDHSTQQLKPAKRQVKEKQTVSTDSENTRFIVTLDGVDPLKFDGDREPVAEAEDNSSVTSNVGSVIPVAPVKPKRQKVETVSISLTASDAENDDEEEEEETVEGVPKTERCKFWPACSNGNQCAFHHPCTPCRSFPNCKFGDKCLYIHPNCKYDAKCTKADCPFTHASKRAPALPQVVPQYIPIPATSTAALLYSVPAPRPTRPTLAASKPKCRFYPKCTNMNCPFTHPKLCRYGLSCGNKSTCVYHHPSLPTKDQFRWSSAGPSSKPEHVSERKFDKGAAQPIPVPVSKT